MKTFVLLKFSAHVTVALTVHSAFPHVTEYVGSILLAVLVLSLSAREAETALGGAATAAALLGKDRTHEFTFNSIGG